MVENHLAAPSPLPEHKRLAVFAGEWAGEEMVYPTRWNAGGPATSRVTARIDLNGFYLIQDSHQMRDGKESFATHGVFTYDREDRTYKLFWHDSLGYYPPSPASGGAFPARVRGFTLSVCPGPRLDSAAFVPLADRLSRSMNPISLPLRLACAAALVLAAQAAPAQAPPKAQAKELRTAFLIAESGFDPAQVTDLYSNTVLVGIFEAPLEYAFLYSPVRMRPNTAAAMPEVSDDFRTFTFRIKPGIHYADDPAFKGKKRELVAEDYVYGIKRHYDPRWKSGNLYILENAKILGLSELRKRALQDKTPFDYDTEIEGLRALDRHTLGWADRLNRSGEAWVTPATIDGKWMIRVSIGALLTEREHLAALWESMQKEAACPD